MTTEREVGGISRTSILWPSLAVFLVLALSVGAGPIGTVTDDVFVSAAEPNELVAASEVSGNVYSLTGSTLDVYGGTVLGQFGVSVGGGSTVTIYGTGFSLGAPTASSAEIIEENTIPVAIHPSSGWQGTVTWTDAGGTGWTMLFTSSTDIAVVVLDVEPVTITVDIDIKPGTDPNPINQGANGVIPVAILTTPDFDAATVDPGTVVLNGASVAVRGKSEKALARLEDVDGDGDDDLMLQMDTTSWGDLETDGLVTLSGFTFDGELIEGTDEVVIVP